jgi:molybdopterin-containing oxidoreductase family membrane subunit
LWSYAYFVEVQTTWYAHEPIEWEVYGFMSSKYIFILLLMLFGNSILPIIALCFKRLRRSIPAMLVVTLLINVGMFIERFLIIVPSLSHKNMPFVWGTYRPTWVELSVTAGAFAGFALMYTLFTKAFPMVAVSDVRELVARESEVPLGRTRLTSIVGKE